jgi:Tfp pilus assembly protein PilV
MHKRQACSNKGESLMESLISLAVLSISFATIGMFILTSLGFTNATTERAEEMQKSVNQIILSSIGAADDSDDPDAADDPVIMYTSEFTLAFASTTSVTFTETRSHDVTIFEKNGFIYFAPPESGD